MAHHGARELITLGHEVRMMPPAYLKPYIRRQKNDASDAAAICEAAHPGDEGFLSPSPYENLNRQQTQPRFRASPA